MVDNMASSSSSSSLSSSWIGVGVGIAVGAAATVAACGLLFSGAFGTGDDGKNKKYVAADKAPPVKIGESISMLPTPCLCVDLDALEHNIREMDRSLEAYPHVNLRPHVKSHKCSGLAKLQLSLSTRAKGVCCATVSEAQAMVRNGGILDIHLSNELVSREKVQQIVQLMRETGARISVCVDSEYGARMLSDSMVSSSSASKADIKMDVLVEVNVGQNRCGVSDAKSAVSLAKFVASLPGLRFVGIQCYHGSVQHTRELADRAAMEDKVATLVREVVEQCGSAGLECSVITGAGTGSYLLECERGFTEVQPGSYLFLDADYAKNLLADGKEMGERVWRQSLFVVTRVISDANSTSPNKWVVVDAGQKSHSVDSGMPLVYERADLVCKNGGDEHFIISSSSSGSSDRLPAQGVLVRLVPGHCDPTFNMHDWVVCIRDFKVESVFRIDARGPGW